MAFDQWIKSKWQMFSWSGGSKKAPYGELVSPSSVSLDYSNPNEKKVTTIIECYVTGTYAASDGGKLFTIRERYSIEVTYSNSTIYESLSRVRAQLIQRFTRENPEFMITSVFVPQMLPPILQRNAEPKFFYGGGRMFRFMTRAEDGRLRLSTEKQIYMSRADRIIKQYGLRRKDALIKKIERKVL